MEVINENWFLDEEDIDVDQYFSIRDRADEILNNEDWDLMKIAK